MDALKDYRAIAQDKYRRHLELYVKGVLGHPLENLSVSVAPMGHASMNHSSFLRESSVMDE